MTECPYCSSGFSKVFHSGSCPKLKAIEYYPDGTVKRVEFKDEPPVVIQREMPDWLKPPYKITCVNISVPIVGHSGYSALVPLDPKGNPL